ncbi:BF3164 family lipoprotein [Algoriphagus marinus]|uniref:BF3164 family lipoprotein n=1 Tax=Algoriphagus marinus TaxID=1925762 RepID=UPI00094B807F|nr:BF3164 family lipoprotein [Algoriphagus marinus]
MTISTNTIRFLVLFFCNLIIYQSNAQTLVQVKKSDFPVKITLQSEKILTEDYNHHHRIFVIDTLLLTMVNSGTNHYHVYHKNTLNYLGPIGVRGEGPDQWEIPQTTVGQFEKANDGIKLWYFDFLRGNYSLMNLTKTLNSKSPYPIVERKLRVNMKIFPYFQLFMGNNNRIYANSWIYEQNRGRIKSFDLESNKIYKSGLFPVIKNSERLPAETINSLYGASFYKHPKQDKFVQAMYMFNRIDIFDENLNVIKTIVDGENWKDNYYDAIDIDPTKEFFEGRTDGFNSLALSENFIYALEADRNVNSEINKENECFIRVYDWDGRPKAYLTVKHDLSSIAIDESNGKLYATDYSHELVLRFDISQLIKSWLK